MKKFKKRRGREKTSEVNAYKTGEFNRVSNHYEKRKNQKSVKRRGTK